MKDILMKYALADLAIARKKGAMAICNTKHGLLEIRHDRDYGKKAYSIVCNWKTVLMFVSRKEAAEFIANSYQVVEAA